MEKRILTADATPRRKRAPLDHRRPASNARRHWTALAAQARPRLEGLRFGDREIALKETADAFGVNAQTLRRALAALRFVESLEAEKFLRKPSLRAAPVAAIEHISRWYAYDREAALRAARQLLLGSYSVARLGADERRARVRARPDLMGQSMLRNCRDRVGPVLRGRFAALAMEESGPRRNDVPTVDFRFRPEGSERWTVAAIIMGPYRDRVRYDLRLGDWIVRALGLARLFERLVLVVPAASIRRRCLTWMRANDIAETAFEIQVITPDP
jgi:hypothetical protein